MYFEVAFLCNTTMESLIMYFEVAFLCNTTMESLIMYFEVAFLCNTTMESLFVSQHQRKQVYRSTNTRVLLSACLTAVDRVS